MKEYLLYQAYGNILVINECKYSLLKLYDVYKQTGLQLPEIIIYTDKPQEFKIFEGNMPLLLQIVTAEQIREWKGEINFVHRVKIKVIKDCLQKFTGKIIYTDTDTYVIKPLTSLFNSIDRSSVLFHEHEGVIESSYQFRKWKRFFEQASLEEPERKKLLQTQMWNAGVIGLENSHLPLLDEVLNMTDQLYKQFHKHIAEQFAFCYVFHKAGIAISAAKESIFHYWDLKELRLLLSKFFLKYGSVPFNKLVEKSRNILPEKMLAEKMIYERSGSFKKIILLFTGKGWSINKYKRTVLLGSE